MARDSAGAAWSKEGGAGWRPFAEIAEIKVTYPTVEKLYKKKGHI
jgi:hypothetical protein